MFSKFCNHKQSFPFFRLKWICSFGFLVVLTFFLTQSFYSQQYNQQYYSPQPQNQNYLRNSTAFNKEIARMEITVHREGFAPLSLTQVPRVQKGDVLKIKLLDEAVNGIKLDQSLYDWTLLVAFVNPNRKMGESRESRVESRESEVGNNSGQQKNKIENPSSVSEEIQFRKKGWYREHSFTVPYDSQPVFFLYPRPNYRSKIEKLISKNYNEVRKLGEKTIDLAGAYAQVGMFLNELQGVLNGNGYYGSGGGSGGNNPYGSSIYGGYNPYNSYNPYNGSGNYGYNAAFNYNLLVAQSVERLARSFNIQIPSNCWQNGVGYSNGYNNYSYGGVNQPGLSPDMVNRLQCVAKNVRLEDLDFSIARMLQQGGILAAAQLSQKYPQIAYWINIAAFAVDFIIKITRKTPLRIVPTVTSSSDNQNGMGYNGGGYNAGTYNQGNYVGTSVNFNSNPNSPAQSMPKISLFAENQPDDSSFVTAYPIVLHKWQADPDPEIISLRPPVLMEPCLHAGINVLKSTDLTEDQLSDNFTKDYTLTMSSTNGFRKEFPLKKNIGLGGWELNIKPEELQQFPKIQMNLESVIKGMRGFNEIKSPPFYLPIAIGGSWQITPESGRDFSVGGKRTITLKNTLGNCRCLRAVIYKPPFGGQFVFEADSPAENKPNYLNRLEYSPDGKEVSFEIDTTNFQPGPGKLELITYGGEKVELQSKLYPLLPNITNLKINKGDREGIIAGERIEQVQAVRINGRRAIVIGAQSPSSSPDYQNPGQPPTYGNQPNYVTPNSGNSLNTYTPSLQPTSQNERVFVFEEAKAGLTENSVTVELEAEDNRMFPVRQNFPVGLSRPAVLTNENREIEAVAIKDEGERRKDEVVVQHSTVIVNGSKTKDQRPKTKDRNPALDLSKLSVFPIETNQISLNIQNVLTDYDFKVENLSIETRLEKSQNGTGYSGGSPIYSNPTFNNYGVGTTLPVPQVEFEVLDWKHLRISLRISEQLQKLLGGRRLQFRIRDRERGDSDWYSIKQTFVRVPQISSITCTNEMSGMCRMNGSTIDYISQVSIDGGQTWFPGAPSTIQVQPTEDGQKSAMIPLLLNQKQLMIKLRDFPQGEGLPVNNFSFVNLVKTTKKEMPDPQKNPTQPNSPNGQPGNQPVQPKQTQYPIQNQPGKGKVNPNIKPVKKN